jgi:hypothetical protein
MRGSHVCASPTHIYTGSKTRLHAPHAQKSIRLQTAMPCDGSMRISGPSCCDAHSCLKMPETITVRELG